MSRLQLYIFKSAPGRKLLAAINDDQDIKSLIADQSAQVAAVRYPSDSKTVFYIAQPLCDGCALHIIRTIPSKPGYFLDATFYVGYDIDIMAEELDELIGLVTDTFMASSVTEEDMNAIAEAFSVEFDLLDKTPHIKKCPVDGVGLLHYGDNFNRSVSDIICMGLYNKPWRTYSSIILIDNSLTADTDTVVNLDSEIDGDDAIDEQEPAAELIYSFTLPMSTPEGGSALEFEISTASPITESPISGYAVKGKIKEGADNVNNLKFSRSGSFKNYLMRVVWGICGLIAGIFLMVIVSMCSDKKENDTDTALQSVENSTYTDFYCYINKIA